MRPRTGVGGAGCVLGVVLLCLAVGLFWDGTYLSYKPCRALSSPDGQQIIGVESIVTHDPLDTVLAFYDQRFGVDSVLEEEMHSGRGTWTHKQLPDSTYFYSCDANDINGLTTETGCVYVHAEDTNTRIELMTLRSEGAHTPCPIE